MNIDIQETIDYLHNQRKEALRECQERIRKISYEIYMLEDHDKFKDWIIYVEKH